MERKDTFKRSREQSPPTQPDQVQSIETNGDHVLLIKDQTPQPISKNTEKNAAPQSNVAKKRKAFHLLRAALLMLRGKKSKPVHVDVASKGRWRTLVGSMRPLHLHNHQHEQAPAPTPALMVENFHEPQPSPSSSPFSSTSSSDMSRYASAQNLQELGRRGECNCDDNIDETEEEFLDGGDEMIDIKATEFIAKFYEQMRIQQDA